MKILFIVKQKHTLCIQFVFRYEFLFQDKRTMDLFLTTLGEQRTNIVLTAPGGKSWTEMKMDRTQQLIDSCFDM